jgi:hypothetical protein
MTPRASSSRNRSLVLLLSLGLGTLGALRAFSSSESQHVFIGGDGRLAYVPYPNGDTIPDFSYAGYGGGLETLAASPASLWPPNHGMVPITVAAAVSDAVDASPATRIVSVASNEPLNGTGDGDTAPDWQITGNLAVDLRAERSGSGAGRVYTITVECRDASGNASRKTVPVAVPNSSGH